MPYAADSLFAKIVGANATTASIEALGGQAAKHVADFHRYEPGHYDYGVAQGTRYWEVANYYDRARTYYVWSAAESDPALGDEYFQKGAALALNYRDCYAPDGGVSAHWSMPCGVALHAITTDDPKSKKWLDGVATSFSAPYYTDNLDDLNAEMDNRIQARCLEAWLLAWLINGQDDKWAQLLRKGLTDILKSQQPDGSYPFTMGQNGQNKPFMVGLLNDAMMFYRRAFEDDDRILPSIQKACDFMWANQWVEAELSFKYSPGEQGGDAVAHDLNNLIIGGYAACGQADRVKKIFEGSFRAWIEGDKQFNQNYREAHRTVAQFAGAVSAWEGGGTVDPPVDPPIDPPAPTEPDIAAAKAALQDAHIALDQAYAAVDAALTALG